jgi:hypothetical protein
VFNADGTTGNPTIGLASNPIIPGTGSIFIPVGTTGQRPAGLDGKIRYNSTDGAYEGYSTGAWRQFSLSGGVTLINTGTGLTGGPITATGTISLANTAVTAASYGSSTQIGTFTVNAQGQLTAAANVTITPAAIGAVASVSGTANEITATGTSVVVLSLPAALTFTGKTVTGGTFLLPIISSISNSGTITIPSGTDTLVARNTTDTLTNKSISGATNTLTNIANASLTNSSVTVGTTAIALGASSLTLGGLTTVTVTQDPTAALDLATKQYVDAVAQGLDPKASVVAGTTANITLSGAQTIDGISIVATDRVLVKDQTAPAENGIYVASATAWARASDMSTWAQVPGAYVFIETGTTLADTGWVCTSNAGGTINVTAMTWAQFSGAGSGVSAISFGTTGLTPSTTTTGSVTVTGTLVVANGGTGAVNATDARTNLVAAKSGTNSDITELYALNGTSYGVAYQNAGNQLIMGTALVFDGTMLYVPGGISGGTF